MAGCTLIYYLLLVPNLVFMFFQKNIFNESLLVQDFWQQYLNIFMIMSKYYRRMNLPTIFIRLPNIFLETLNRSYHNLSM